MGKLKFGKRLFFLAAVFCLILSTVAAVGTVAGCSGRKTAEEKIRDLEFTVTAGEEVPGELKEIIEQKKKDPFRLTYNAGQDLYIAAGYGQQKTGGYSISVPELYLTDNSINIKTELIGPGKEEQCGLEPTYPYIVIKTEWIERPVVFK